MVGEGGSVLTVCPAGGSRFKFVAQVVVTALRRRPRVVLAGLVNFGPLAFSLRTTGLVRSYAVQLYGAEVWEKLPFHRRFALQKADTLATITVFTAEQAAVANGVLAPSVRLLSPVIDDTWFVESEGECLVNELRRRPHELLSVARLDASEGKKGVDRVLEALGSAEVLKLDWYYRVVGDGSDRPRLEHLAEELGIAGRVQFLGAVASQELHRCFQRCDVFVLPSTQEGFGIVFLEAAAYGKPVIGARFGGIPEVVVHGETGILVDAADPDELKKSIVSLLSDPERRGRLGRNGRLRVAQHFRPVNFLAQLDAVLGLPRSSCRTSRPAGG
jgi:glycosyltransferase involved in cell wall biosynthesis